MASQISFFNKPYNELNGKVKTVEEKEHYFMDGKWIFFKHWITDFESSNKVSMKYFDEAGICYGFGQSEIDETGFVKKHITYSRNNQPLYLFHNEWDGEKLTFRSYNMDNFSAETIYNRNGDMIYNYDANSGDIENYKYDENGYLIEEVHRYGILNKHNWCDTVDIIKYDKETKFTNRRRYNIETFDLIREYEYYNDESGEIQIQILPNGEMSIDDFSFPVLSHTVKDNYGNEIILDYIDIDGNPARHIERIINYYE